MIRLPQTSSNQYRIVLRLYAGPATSSEIGDLIFVSTPDAGQALTRMRKRGLVERAGEGEGARGQSVARWALTDACRVAIDHQRREAAQVNSPTAAAA
jgi:predicted ArsR family transcriptional regulator